MAQSRLIELSYFDPHTSIRLTTYADTIVTDYSSPNRIISAVRFLSLIHILLNRPMQHDGQLLAVDVAVGTEAAVVQAVDQPQRGGLAQMCIRDST